MRSYANTVPVAPTYSFDNSVSEWPSLVVGSLLSEQRDRIEHYIGSVFQTAYGAHLSEFLPLLLSLESHGQPSAALGLRSAAFGPLFVERYLDTSAEFAIEQAHGQHCDRAYIMELGNLVATTPRHSALLYILAVAAMHEAGMHYLMFAANRKVRASIKRCGFTPKVICAADAICLGDKVEDWGSYYDGNPQVMAADLALTMAQAHEQPAIAKQLDDYRDSIRRLAVLIRGAG